MVHSLAAHLLGRHPGGGAEHLPGLGEIWRAQLGQAEITQAQIARAILRIHRQ